MFILSFICVIPVVCGLLRRRDSAGFLLCVYIYILVGDPIIRREGLAEFVCLFLFAFIFVCYLGGGGGNLFVCFLVFVCLFVFV